jgi:hypothetical protein
VLIAGIGALCVGGIGALFVVSAHALVAPIAAIERASAGLAAKRSRDLMKARTYHGSGYDSVWSLYLMLGLIALILCGGAAALVDIIGIGNHLSGVNLRQMRPVIEAAVGLIPIYLTLWVVVPVWAVTVTIIYFERRVRLEGYDIEALAADVWHPDREDRLRA